MKNVNFTGAVVQCDIKMRQSRCFSMCTARISFGGEIMSINVPCPIETVPGDTIDITVSLPK
jgi:hypothetical protein